MAIDIDKFKTYYSVLFLLKINHLLHQFISIGFTEVTVAIH